MALTKVTGQVIKNTTDVTVGVLTVTNTLAVGGTVSIGGTLTYEDVTNVDAVGLITARNGIVVGSGITLSKDGDGFFTGVVTATSYRGDGANLTGINADVVDDTTPQLGGDLDTNTKNIKFGDSGTPGASGDDTLIFGADDDMRMYHDGTDAFISNNTGAFVVQDSHAGANAIIVRKGAEVELMHNNSQKFETTSYGTKVTGYQSSSSYIGFHVVGQLNDHGFGTNHGSGITNFDIDYYSPIPMFGTKTIQSGSSYLSFPSYASGNYVKFTAPVAGLYQLELMASVETHHGGDWCAFGWELNTTTVSSDGDLANNGLGVLAVYERAGGDEGAGSHFSTTIYMAESDYAILYHQSAASIRFKGNQYYVRGHLIH